LVSAVLKSKIQQNSTFQWSFGQRNCRKNAPGKRYFDVKVISVEGFLSDHYNPANKTVNLSPDVYNGTSVSAAAVAAHECGHAVQHATNYGPLQFRSKMVPAVQISSMLVNWFCWPVWY
jgi:Zn-dependent membrane protease YugP